MNAITLAIKNIRGNGLRNLFVFLCVGVLVGFFVATNLVASGAQNVAQRMESPGNVTPVSYTILVEKQPGNMSPGSREASVLALSAVVVLVALTFIATLNEHRQDIAVLRTIGASRSFVFVRLTAEVVLPVLGASLLGAVIASVGVYAFHDFITFSLGEPFFFPSFIPLLWIFAGGVAITVIAVFFVTLIPVYLISREEPAIS